MKRMTRKKALQILIENAAANAAGVGCGFRVEHSEKRCMLVRDAIIRLWRDAYTWDIGNNDLLNLGLPGTAE